jgi:hypothetical protein
MARQLWLQSGQRSEPSVASALSRQRRNEVDIEKGGCSVVLVLALLLVLIFFGAGFALHILWIAAAILLVLWLVGFVIGRGEGAGSHRFYRW